MYKYALRRLLLAVPVLLLSSLIVFGLMRVMPGDALTALMGESGNVGEQGAGQAPEGPAPRPAVPRAVPALGLADGELPPRRLDLHQGADRGRASPRRFPVTLELAALAMILGLVIAVPIGVLSATRQDSAADYVGRVVAVSGPLVARFLARHARDHVRGDLVPLDPRRSAT